MVAASRVIAVRKLPLSVGAAADFRARRCQGIGHGPDPSRPPLFETNGRSCRESQDPTTTRATRTVGQHGPSIGGGVTCPTVGPNGSSGLSAVSYTHLTLPTNREV